MRTVLKTLALGVLCFAPQLAVAEDAALIIVSDDYRRLPDVPGAVQAAEMAQSLESAGFRVVSSLNQDAPATWETITRFREVASGADRIFVLLSGHMLSAPSEAWLLTREAVRPDIFSVGGEAVPLGPILGIAAERPGQAVVMLAQSGEAVVAPGLRPGADVEAPQGVTVVSGPIDQLLRAAREVVLVPGAGIVSGLGASFGDLEVTGFETDAVPFLPMPSDGPAAPVAPAAPDMDAAWWDVVREIGTVAGYEAYLARFPRGRFASAARDAISRIEGNAETRAQAAEAALGFNRDARRDIQRDLSLLGFNPRGIDGVFGPGSRAAITAWQRTGGFPSTGYLTAEQVRTLRDAAAVRAAELEAEAARRQAEEERRDTAYWRETGRGASEAGLRDYLARYPDGLFADVAEARLAEIEADKREAARAEERQAWDRARAADSVVAYRDYLERYPRGVFSEEARARLDELTRGDDDGEAEAARAEENLVAGNGIIRLLVENRLNAAGFDPGRIDGVFDTESRRAIRRFQRTNGISVTGYVTQETMVRLLAVR
jgi:peptidoglycan hydrolase-like protein with peptidoglycan-binding domain